MSHNEGIFALKDVTGHAISDSNFRRTIFLRFNDNMSRNMTKPTK